MINDIISALEKHWWDFNKATCIKSEEEEQMVVDWITFYYKRIGLYVPATSSR